MIPRILFKYLAPERMDVLYDQLIRFTPAAEFNDPYDSLPSTEPTPAETPEETSAPLMGGLGDRAEDIRRKNRASIQAEANAQVAHIRGQEGVLSLSATSRSLPMWAHYAASHEGFVLVFNARHHFFAGDISEDRKSSSLAKVYYRDRPNLFRDGSLALIVKSPQWEHEREYRQFRSLRHADRVLQGGIHLFPFPLDAVRAIVLGCRSSNRLEREARVLRMKREYSHIKLFKMKTHDETFALKAASLEKE